MNNNTNDTVYSAFDSLRTKAEAAHIVEATEVTVDNGQLVIKLALSDIAASRPVKGALGFKLAPISFAVSGRTYRINPGWTTLTGRS